MTFPILENEKLSVIKEDGFVNVYYGARSITPIDVMFVDGLPVDFRDEIVKYSGTPEYLYDFKNITQVGSMRWEVCEKHQINVFSNTDTKDDCLIQGEGSFEYVLMFRTEIKSGEDIDWERIKDLTKTLQSDIENKDKMRVRQIGMMICQEFDLNVEIKVNGTWKAI